MMSVRTGADPHSPGLGVWFYVDETPVAFISCIAFERPGLTHREIDAGHTAERMGKDEASFYLALLAEVSPAAHKLVEHAQAGSPFPPLAADLQ